MRSLPVPPGLALPPSHVATLGREPLLTLTEGSPLGADALRLCSPVTHVRGDAPPFLVMHGEADGLVPIEQSEVFVDAMERAGASVDFRRVPGADHAWMGVDSVPLIDEAVAWIRVHTREAILEGTP